MDKLKLSFGDRRNYEWIVNEKAIVCKITCSIKSILPAYLNVYREKMSRLFPNFINYYDEVIFDSVGVAKCNEGDEWDTTLGEHIAEARAKQKAYDIAERFIRTLTNLIDKDLDDMFDFSTNLEYQENHESKHINWLITGEE